MNTVCKTHKRLTLVIGSAMLASTMIGCGGGSDEAGATLPVVNTNDRSTAETTPTSDAVSDDPEEAQLQFERCLAERGIDLSSQSGSLEDGMLVIEGSSDDAPDEGTDDNGDATFAAINACEKYLEAAYGATDADPALDAEIADFNLEFERCMADAGFEMTLDENDTFTFDVDSAEDDAAFNEAMNTCTQ